jgi:hypothetical protein
LHFLLISFGNTLRARGVGSHERHYSKLQSSVRLPTVVGEYVAEQHAEEGQGSNLPALDKEVGIASRSVIFYVVVAGAATIHYVFHA